MSVIQLQYNLSPTFPFRQVEDNRLETAWATPHRRLNQLSTTANREDIVPSFNIIHIWGFFWTPVTYCT